MTATTTTATVAPAVSLTDLVIIGRGTLIQNKSGTIRFNVPIDASAKDATAYAFARQDNGLVLYSGTSANGIKARLKSLQAHPTVNKALHAKLLPHVDAAIFAYDASAVMVGNNLAGADARHAMVAAWGSIGNKHGLSPIALHSAPAPVVEASSEDDDTDAGDLPETLPGDEDGAPVMIGAEDGATTDEPAAEPTPEDGATTDEPAAEPSTTGPETGATFETPDGEPVTLGDKLDASEPDQPADDDSATVEPSTDGETAPEPVAAPARRGKRGRKAH